MIASNHDPHQKVRTDHLQRDAYLYIRQSTLQQVFHNTESTQRQYGLKQRAIVLGWPAERVNVIDGDQGQSGASAADREGFQKLVAEVGMGRAGIVLGLEVSRLARNNCDWHRLLEICGLTDTLILDEDGLYDPGNFNDRLLLGLKGAMSEAELHVLRARLQGGIRSKARRGGLRVPLPIGLVYDAQGKVILDPDPQIQQALRTLFQVYQRQGSARAVVSYFYKNELTFPRRFRRGINKGQLVWGPLGHTRTLEVLHNPRYAGAFVFGRTKVCKRLNAPAELNRQGYLSSMKHPFTPYNVAKLRRKYGLKCRYDRLRDKGLYTASEMATELGVARTTIRIWYAHGLLKGYEYNDRGERLYELPPQDQRPKKQQGQQGRLSKRGQYSPFTPHAANEVHHGP